MDLPRAFNCIPHDLLIAKLTAYGFGPYIYLYLNYRKQREKINSMTIDFTNIVSGVPQGSIVDPVLFNIFLTLS